MPASVQCRSHVADHLDGADGVGDKISVDGGHPAGLSGVDVAGVAVGGVVHVQRRVRSLVDQGSASERRVVTSVPTRHEERSP